MKIRKQKEEALIVIPKTVTEYMGWKFGDEVIIELCNKKKNQIVIKKIIKEK